MEYVWIGVGVRKELGEKVDFVVGLIGFYGLMVDLLNGICVKW